MRLLALIVLAVAADDWVQTPGGWKIHKACIFELPNGGRIDMNHVRTCPYKAKAPEIQIYAIDTVYQAPSNGLVTQMNTSWTTPALPVTLSSQVVYFWPGFKSQQPVMGYPVLQPVLQFGQQGRYWMLQSWFVWGNENIAYTGPAIAINPGEGIDSYMRYDSATQTWTCYGLNKNSTKSSELTLTRAKIQNTDFQYAMLVLETVMPDSAYCNLYPGGDDKVVFTNIRVNDAAVPKWTIQVSEHECNQNATVNADSSVTFSWINK